MSEDFEDFKERVRAERSVRDQRDAAERLIPGERLRREIREAFVDRQDDRPAPRDAHGADEPPRPRAAE